MNYHLWEIRLRQRSRAFCQMYVDGSLSDLYDDDRDAYYRQVKRIRKLYADCVARFGRGSVVEIISAVEDDFGAGDFLQSFLP